MIINERLIENETIKEVLKVLRFYYTDISIVNKVANFVNNLWKMEDGEKRELDKFNITVTCFVSYDGYDNEIKRYIINK